MLSLPDAEALRAALAQPLDPQLQTILAEILETAEAHGVGQLTHVCVIQSGDAEDAIVHDLGWSPLTSPLDGERFSSPAFVPYWAWLEERGGWYQLIHTIGDDGFAFVLLIERSLGVPSDLTRMCCEFAK